MGERVRDAIARDEDSVLVAAIENAEHPGAMLPVDGLQVEHDAAKAFAKAQVVIDFSVPSATLSALDAAASQTLPYVCGTTGLSDAERERMARYAEKIPLVWAANFSVSVNVLFHLTRRATELLGDGYDAEIVELHHRAKRDAPSGTALHLAERVAEAREQKLAKQLVAERYGDTGARPEGAIGVQTLRGGDAPGEHTVYLIGQGERLELTHRAATRDHFAAGALRAAKWAVAQSPGLYGMEDVLGLQGP